MKKIILIFSALLLIIFISNTLLANNRLEMPDFQIGGIVLGQQTNEKEIVNIFGKPDKTEKSNQGIRCKNYIYKGLIIFTAFEGKKQTYNRFEINGGNYSLNNGIKIGDPIKNIIKKYGLDLGQKETDIDFIYSLRTAGNGFYIIQFSREYQRISRIQGYIMPTCQDP